MNKVERGKDAQDQTSMAKPKQPDAKDPASPKPEQDAGNFETTDRGQAIPVEDMSSANDEGAN